MTAPVARDGFQHHEVVEFPVQDGRQAQLRQFVELQAHGATLEAEPFGVAPHGG